MLGFLLFLSVPVLLVLPVGFGVGWLGQIIPHGGAWRLFWVLAALFLPGVLLHGYLDETAQSALRIPGAAPIMHTFQLQTVALFGLTAGLTIWATLKKPWLAPLPLLLMPFVFYYCVLPPIYGAGPLLDEHLYAQLDGAVNRGLFIFCLLGTAFLLGMAAGHSAAFRFCARQGQQYDQPQQHGGSQHQQR